MRAVGDRCVDRIVEQLLQLRIQLTQTHGLAAAKRAAGEFGARESYLAGAVGDMSLRFFDLQGKPVRTPLDERVIGLPLEDLARIPRVMALAGGASKTLAIMGALRTGVIDVLIPDKFTAARLAGEPAPSMKGGQP